MERDDLRNALERKLARFKTAGLDTALVEARLAELGAAPEALATEADTGTGNYEDRTLAQLRALVDERGVEVDKRSREQMIAALRGED